MSTTDNDGETPSEREPDERPPQRFHDLYRADLRPFEPVSDTQLLGAIQRAEVHDEHDHASRADIAAHLGFAHNSWTTRRLRPQLDALRSAGRMRDVRRYGLNLLALTAAGRRALREARRMKVKCSCRDRAPVVEFVWVRVTDVAKGRRQGLVACRAALPFEGF
jgi:hypothetical protein